MIALKANLASAKIFAGALAAMLLAACAETTNSPAPAEPTTKLAAATINKLTKGFTAAQVRELLGAPQTIKPLSSGAPNSLIWSYPVRTSTDVLSVPVSTQEVPAVNPVTGQEITRTEPVYQNRTTETVDTLHLLMVNDQLVEWRVVRNEKRQYQ